ncbi:hypothetical protein BKA82DRAFT_4021275 [Pisolithus tinctorius]|nr:hypothetical protein BKA82DRAFT_4021275 [Pisolithus tinctorius]
MPPLMKKQKQARQQQASGTKYFDNGLVEDLLDISLDPSYEPDSGLQDDWDATDSDCSIVNDMSFSLLDCNVQESDGSGECKAQDDIVKFKAEDTLDYVEKCAHKAATCAQRFWDDVTSFLTSCDHNAQSEPTTSELVHTTLATPEPQAGDTAVAATFLDVTEDDNDSAESISVMGCINKLMADAKKYKSFTSLFHLSSLKHFINLWDKYKQNPRIKAPMAIRRYLTVLVMITPLLLMKQVNAVILPALGLDATDHNISEGTAQWWLGKLGLQRTYTDDSLEPVEPQLGPGEQLHILVMHDESIVHANELRRQNNDGFWTNEKLVKQSSAHGAFAKDALNAKEMNVRPGGKQWLMHNTFIPMDNPNPDLHGKPQAMVFPPDLPPHHPDFEFHGQVKGMQHILKECGLISVLEAANGGKVVRECSTCKLSREVQEQLHWEALATAEGADEPGKSNLDMLQESLRTDCCFCTASDGTFLTTKCLVPQILDDCPVKTIHAFFRKTWHYMDAYRKGLNACQAEFAVKKYKSHGHCGPMLIMSIGVLLN